MIVIFLSDFPNTSIFTSDFYYCTCYYFARNGLNTTLEDHHNTSALLNISGSAQVYTCEEKIQGCKLFQLPWKPSHAHFENLPKTSDIVFSLSLFCPTYLYSLLSVPFVYFLPFLLFPPPFPLFSSLFTSPLEKLLISS